MVSVSKDYKESKEERYTNIEESVSKRNLILVMGKYITSRLNTSHTGKHLAQSKNGMLVTYPCQANNAGFMNITEF